MPINRIQFQPGLSLATFFQRYGTLARCQQALGREGQTLNLKSQAVFPAVPFGLWLSSMPFRKPHGSAIARVRP